MRFPKLKLTDKIKQFNFEPLENEEESLKYSEKFIKENFLKKEKADKLKQTKISLKKSIKNILI